VTDGERAVDPFANGVLEPDELRGDPRRRSRSAAPRAGSASATTASRPARPAGPI